MKLLTLLIVLILSHSSYAAGVFYGSSAGHIGYDTHCGVELNENIGLVGVHYNDYYVATFNNSFNNQSYVFSKRYADNIGPVTAGFHAGVVHGYSVQKFFDCDANDSPDLIPFIAPTVEFDLGRVDLKLIVLGTAYTIAVGVEL